MSNRLSLIKKHITADLEGIEIGPYHNPIVPKAAGNRVLVMDVFPAEQLRTMAAEDPCLAADAATRIEEVDLVGSCDRIVELVEDKDKIGKIGFVISSHNIEHMPNPIKFLQGCSKIMKDKGIVSMAVPDHRCCFDYFRPYSTTADLLAAFLHNVEQPTNFQHFAINSLHSRYRRDNELLGSFSPDNDPRNVVPLRSLREAMNTWLSSEKSQTTEYKDTHCWTFTPSSFELILHDLQHLGVLPFEVLEVTPTHGHEFFVHLQNNSSVKAPESDDEFYNKRASLLFQIKNEQAENAPVYFELKKRHAETVARYETQLAELRRIIGP